MGIGAGMFLIAAGAILAFAQDVTVAGPDLQTASQVLMVAGMAGLGLSVFWNLHHTPEAVKAIRQRHITDVAATNSRPRTTSATGSGYPACALGARPREQRIPILVTV